MTTEPTDESANGAGLRFTIEAKREPDNKPVFFFHGSFKGEDFAGTADDMNTAWSMAVECLEMISNDNY